MARHERGRGTSSPPSRSRSRASVSGQEATGLDRTRRRRRLRLGDRARRIGQGSARVLRRPAGHPSRFDGIELDSTPGFNFHGFVVHDHRRRPRRNRRSRRPHLPRRRHARSQAASASSSKGLSSSGPRAGPGSGTSPSTRVRQRHPDLLLGVLVRRRTARRVNVTPDKTLAGNHGDDFNWYQHWYAPAPAPYSVINARKWVPVPDGWAVGAGVTIGSSDGKAWSLRALLAIVAPARSSSSRAASRS